MFKKILENVQKDSGECSRRFWGMFKKILGNVQEDSGKCSRRFRGMLKKIPGNVEKGSGECSRRFRGIFKKIPGNVEKDSGECWERFWGMFKKILGNFVKSCEILFIFYQILQLNCGKTKKCFLRCYLLLITNLLRLNTVFLSFFSFLSVFMLKKRCSYWV